MLKRSGLQIKFSIGVVYWRCIPLYSLVCTIVLIGVNSCSRQPNQIKISSGTTSGYYSRLVEQIGVSTRNTVGLDVQNLSSEGSRQNLQRLLDRQADFALVQLDVVSDVMRQGKVQAAAILANEPIHVIARSDSKLRSLTDLAGKRVGIGSEGSGIRFTADQLMGAIGLRVSTDSSSFDQVFERLATRQVDAAIYVGSVGASEKLRQRSASNPALRLLPMPPEQKLTQIKQQYREMLLADQIDIKAYIELMELISVMTLVPQTSAVAPLPSIPHV